MPILLDFISIFVPEIVPNNKLFVYIMRLDFYVSQILPNGNAEKTHLFISESSVENLIIPDFSSVIKEWISCERSVSSHFLFGLDVNFD